MAQLWAEMDRNVRSRNRADNVAKRPVPGINHHLPGVRWVGGKGTAMAGRGEAESAGSTPLSVERPERHLDRLAVHLGVLLGGAQESVAHLVPHGTGTSVWSGHPNTDEPLRRRLLTADGLDDLGLKPRTSEVVRVVGTEHHTGQHR